MTEASLWRADLTGAYLGQANLADADLSRAKLTWANLASARLTNARLSSANLTEAQLAGAVLGGANLRGADLSGANLRGANLRGADLSGADLSDARNLTQAQLDAAFGTEQTRLPSGLRHPESWLQSPADGQGLPQDLSRWEPLITALAATVRGDEEAAMTLWAMLDRLASFGWTALVTMLRRILAGERGEDLLTGPDPFVTSIAREILRRLSHDHERRTLGETAAGRDED